VHLGKPTGKKVGEGQIGFSKEGKVTTTIPLQQVPAGNMQDVYLVVRPTGAGEGNKPLLQTVQFVPQANSWLLKYKDDVLVHQAQVTMC